MIDWVNLAMNAVWIAGCVVGLAILSINQWEARSTGTRLRDALKRPITQTMLFLAAILFSLGMLGTSTLWYERIAWGVLAIAFGIQAWLVYKHARMH